MKVVIEYPSVGSTYCRQEFGVYGYDTYSPSSVLAGQTRRRWLAAFDTLAEAEAAYPDAEVWHESLFQEPDLSHLPDDGDY